MLVTFKTKYYSNITLFGNIALTFIKIMGHGGTVPGAIRAEDVPAALQRLSKAIEQQSASPKPAPSSGYDDDNEDNEPVVSLRQRALPLIELLHSAVESESNVMWE
ncbi:DUF1840 domain-containing protein [Shewanella atlantica]|uniref:DUF1840 domain-containing protein n=1 Tax=Shewanella atlantica TaxID=271099 RepID=A0A3S0ICY7_9GAMM|nr:DUF1840 domain-containing protein [Shewanella atlantica]RTR29774.1 DUF1840 domain-containing protein [Shewanella atlantica]